MKTTFTLETNRRGRPSDDLNLPDGFVWEVFRQGKSTGLKLTSSELRAWLKESHEKLGGLRFVAVVE